MRIRFFARAVLAAGSLCAPLLVASCGPANSPARQSYISDQIDRLSDANVPKDVAAAVNKVDYRFIALNGVGLMIPGVDDFDVKTIKEKYGVRMIENTTASPRTKQEERLQVVAWGYAAEYNKLLREKLPGLH